MREQRTVGARTGAPVVAVIGAGPAGLMAAEQAALCGASVQVYDAMPSAGRKFLLAGRGGLNLTHAETSERFRARYGGSVTLAGALDHFDAAALRAWADELGAATFVGSSGRVFPRAMKASPLLRAWLQKLGAQNVGFEFRHRLIGIERAGRSWSLRFATPRGESTIAADAVVLALGGASWPRLGSDGAWSQLLHNRGVGLTEFQASNCGYSCAWSAHLRERFAGAAIKNVRAWVDAQSATAVRGECTLTDYGIEGGVIYALSMPLRTQWRAQGWAQLRLDLVPDRSLEQVHAALSAPRAGRSLATVLTRTLALDAAKRALLHECLPAATRAPARELAHALKALPLRLDAPRPIAEAISTAGGVRRDALTADFMLDAMPGVFAAGEMQDWDAPTGGYLLTAAIATGVVAGRAAARWAVQAEIVAD